MEGYDFMEQLVNSFVADQLGEICQKDEEYQKRLREEDLMYEKLSGELPEEQAVELERYFEAASLTVARKETLIYIQGMKDLLALLKAIS